MKLLAFCFLLTLLSCNRSVFKERWLRQKSPAHFTVRIETSKGIIDAAFTREWSPLAVDRVYTQIRHRLYDHVLFYRTVPNFVAQFGTGDSVKGGLWSRHIVPDEPVVQKNDRGTISFARSGKDSRGTQLYINLKNNNKLDTLHYAGVTGFPVLGRITKGMEVADSLYNGYGDKVFEKYEQMADRKAFLALFPKLDSIKRIYITGKRK